jgi:hypothetical protein
LQVKTKDAIFIFNHAKESGNDMTGGAFKVDRVTLDDARLDPYSLTDFEDPEEFKRRISTLSVDEEVIEKLLTKVAWYSYRRLNFVDRTERFVQTYNAVYLALINFNAQLSEWQRKDRINKGSYINHRELMAPWVDPKCTTSLKTNPRWIHWVKARRCADKRGMIYEDYVAGALHAARRRGWKHWPHPQALHSKKLLGFIDRHENSIESYEVKRYEKLMKLSDDPYFKADAYVCSEDQNAYLMHVAKEMQRLHPGIEGMPNLIADRSWKDFQAEGRIPAFLSRDDVLNRKFRIFAKR